MHAERAHENADEDLGLAQLFAGDVVDRDGLALLAGNDRLVGRGPLDVDDRAVGRADEVIAPRNRSRRIAPEPIVTPEQVGRGQQKHDRQPLRSPATQESCFHTLGSRMRTTATPEAKGKSTYSKAALCRLALRTQPALHARVAEEFADVDVGVVQEEIGVLARVLQAWPRRRAARGHRNDCRR